MKGLEIIESLKETVIKDLKKGASKSLAEFLESDRKKLFFWQGAQAFICYDICHRLGISIEGFLGSKISARCMVLPVEIPFYVADQFEADSDEYDVLIAVHERNNSEIKELLGRCGFRHVFYSDNWKDTNREYRTSFFNGFLKIEMGSLYCANMEILEWKNFRIWNMINQPEEYSSMFMGDFFDIIAPSIFNNEEYTREGGYEQILDGGRVTVEKKDIVLDLGANIGMFSCVAASKGKEVYAFEPTPEVKKLLDQQKKLYQNLHTEEYAVFNQVGTCKFSVNAMTTDDVNTGANTLFADRISGNLELRQSEVKAITIDMFVEERGLSSVDFIKADIEGAERYMLEGAKETLKRFAPKLSLCTYHLPDDPEVLEDLILKYNPNYIIKQGAKKLWAYVP